MSFYAAGGTYVGLLSFTGQGNPILYLNGATLSAPTGSNLPATAAVGRYGSFVGPTANNNFAGSGLPNESKQFPVRFGPIHGFVTFANSKRVGATVGPSIPSYGN